MGRGKFRSNLLSAVGVVWRVVHTCVIAVDVRVYIIAWFNHTKLILVSSWKKRILHFSKSLAGCTLSKVRRCGNCLLVHVLISADAPEIRCQKLLALRQVSTLVDLIFTWTQSLLWFKSHHFLILVDFLLISIFNILFHSARVLPVVLSRSSMLFVRHLIVFLFYRCILILFITLLDSWVSRLRLILNGILRRAEKRLLHAKRIV